MESVDKTHKVLGYDANNVAIMELRFTVFKDVHKL